VLLRVLCVRIIDRVCDLANLRSVFRRDQLQSLQLQRQSQWQFAGAG
jgi:hypothetical protein